MNETLMRNAIKQKLKDWSIKFLRIETGATALSVPDLYYYSDRPRQFDGWMELKRVPTFNIERITIPWQPGQLPRAIEFINAGIKYWLVVSADDTDEFAFISNRGRIKKEYWVNEIHRRSFKLNEISSEQLYNLICYYKY